MPKGHTIPIDQIVPEAVNRRIAELEGGIVTAAVAVYEIVHPDGQRYLHYVYDSDSGLWTNLGMLEAVAKMIAHEFTCNRGGDEDAA